MNPIIVLGSGLAGYTVIRELRKLDSELPITLVSRDSGDFYSKPTLSNAFAQKKDAAGLLQTAAAGMAQQLNFELLANTEVHSLQRSEKKLLTTNGVLEYHKLVLALGADPIRIPMQGNAATSALSVNDLSDYAQLRVALAQAKSVAIMGAGLIGCEFANDLALAGYQVSIIDPGSYPLASLMPEQAGRQLLEPLAKIGVTWHFGAAVQAIDTTPSGYALSLTGGTTLKADVVLSAVGLRPRIQLAREAGLTVNRGIVVNNQLCSSDESIFALGDCAEIEGAVRPFVLPIMHAGKTLARILRGEPTPLNFPSMPVVVKTPAHPVALLPVSQGASGSWQVLETGLGIKMGFFNEQQKLTGFVLTGQYSSERNDMLKKIATGTL